MIDKNGYHNIDIPSELSYVVKHAINDGLNQKKHIQHTFLKKCTIAAASVLCFIVVLNTSQSFAAVVYKIPLVGQLCRIITFREEHVEDDIQYIDVKIPKIDNTGKTEMEKRVNLEIQKNTNQLLEDTTTRAKEYYKAFVETGGNPKEYIPLGVTLDYDIKCINPKYVSFIILYYETKFSAYNTQYFYNIDIETGKIITLKDWFGTQYKQIVANSIEQEIALWDEEQKKLLWDNLEFTNLITENTDFYIAEDGNVVVVFPKYEIAAGSAGSLEFKILPESK